MENFGINVQSPICGKSLPFGRYRNTLRGGSPYGGFPALIAQKKGEPEGPPIDYISGNAGYFEDSSTATATATVAPTIGLLPIPMSPIISTCAGTEDEPANWASPCILPMVSVMP